MSIALVRVTLAILVCQLVVAKVYDPAAAGSIRGQIVFRGTQPSARALDMTSDPACVRAATGTISDDSVLVSPQGSLANAFVYVKEGLDPALTFDTPSDPIQLDQKGCQFVPRVLGVRVGQPLFILNSDPTLQDIHGKSRQSPEFNIGQPIQGMRTTHTFSAPEVMVPVIDDIHPWKFAFVGVMAHPFFAVTAADGTFSIAGVPPGDYTIEAWHETLGVLTKRVTIGSRQTGTVQFEFGK